MPNNALSGYSGVQFVRSDLTTLLAVAQLNVAHITSDGIALETVDAYRYLGKLIIHSGQGENGIKSVYLRHRCCLSTCTSVYGLKAQSLSIGCEMHAIVFV